MSSLALSGVARAEPPACVGRHSALASAPAQLVFGPAGLGTLPEACPGSDVRVRGAASALIARDDFYGLLQVGGQLGLRHRLGPNGWLSLILPGFEYRFGANATVEASSLSLGAGAFGYHHAIRISRRWLVSPWGRVLLPTETAARRARRFGFEQGVSLLGALSPQLTWLFGATYPVYVTINGDAEYWVAFPSYVSELAYHPLRPLSLVLGAGLRLRAGERPGFESFDPRAALRFHAGRGLHAELAAAAPLWGNDRTDLVVSTSFYLAFDEER